MTIKNNKILKASAIATVLAIGLLSTGYTLKNKNAELAVKENEMEITTLKSSVEDVLGEREVKYNKDNITSVSLDKKVSDEEKIEVKVILERDEDIRENSSSDRKQMSVVATAYTGGNSKTATGTTPKWGTIAVDPSVIPYGTKVYIPKFNKTFIAEDCGGAIKGNKIDIYMNNNEQAIKWGRKTIDIYIVK